MDPEARRLIAEAEFKPDRTVTVVRMVVASVLFLAFPLTVIGRAPPDNPVLARQISLAAGTIIGYLVLGIASFVAARPAPHWGAGPPYRTGRCAVAGGR